MILICYLYYLYIHIMIQASHTLRELVTDKYFNYLINNPVFYDIFVLLQH